MDDARLEGLLDRLEGVEENEVLDEILELLSDRYIRHTLYYLSERSTTSLDTLADIIAGWEAIETDTIITPEDHKRIRIHLYHVTLPKLDAYDYIYFDTTDYTIERSNRFSIITTLWDDFFDPK